MSEFYEAKDKSEKIIESSITHDIKIISFFDKNFPTLLLESKFNPGLIYIKGDIKNLSKRKVAVIGTRTPTEHGKIISGRISSYLSQNDICVVSGLALGCDTQAHKSSCTEIGSTIAVLGHGLDSVYPHENLSLAKTILDNSGCLLSAYPVGIKPNSYTFASRDNIQAGLSESVVLVQSDIIGGSLFTSYAILEDKRRLIVVEPTARDKKNNERVIQANLSLISEKEHTKQIDSVKMKYFFQKYLDNIFILHSKNEYKLIFNV